MGTCRKVTSLHTDFTTGTKARYKDTKILTPTAFISRELTACMVSGPAACMVRCVRGAMARCVRGAACVASGPAACVAKHVWQAGPLRAWHSMCGERARCVRGPACVASGPAACVAKRAWRTLCVATGSGPSASVARSQGGREGGRAPYPYRNFPGENQKLSRVGNPTGS